MNGFLNIDKPKGITSFGVVKNIRKRLGVKKVGHAGNLDPDATGVLVLGVGKGTRFLEYITTLEKEYIATVKLGILTDTLDISGEVIDEKPVPDIEESRLKVILKKFVGEIFQTPPAFSAVRIGGKRLYELAREGVLVNKKPKKVKIYKIELLGVAGDEFMIRVVCSKGTYIRSLAKDIAEALGTYGIVKELRRMRIGHFRVDDAVSPDVDDLEKFIMPIDKGLAHLNEIVLSERAAWYFRNGSKIGMGGIVHKSRFVKAFEHVRVYDNLGNFIGVGYMKWDGVQPEKVLPAEGS